MFNQAFALESKCDIISMASLGTFTYSMFAAGDNTNTVSLWKSGEKYPIKVFSFSEIGRPQLRNHIAHILKR